MTLPGRMSVVRRVMLKLLLSTAAAAQPLNATGGEISADFTASPELQPSIVDSGTGAPVVNITAPNSSGLSHNKFGDFDVGPEGLILNNSTAGPAASQIGGQVEANPNFIDGIGAEIILNEVTGTERSVLEGFLEVHGSPADVIIANPNGLTCDGCGFLNTPRVTLSTGTPEFGEDQSLKALFVRGGDIKIGTKGSNLGSVSVFDIVSRKISLEGPVMGSGALNLIAGANRYHYDGREVEALPGDGNEPEVAIDSTALGGMYAGRISIISNDRGSGVNMQGGMVANAGALSLSADGKLSFAVAESKEGINARSKSASVHVGQLARTQGVIVLEGLTSVQLAEKALHYAQRDAELSATTVVIGKGAIAAAGTDGNGHLTKKGTLAISADSVHAPGGKLAAGLLLSITAEEMDMARTTQAEGVALHSRGNIVITADTIRAANSTSETEGDLVVASGGHLELEGGIYRASGLLSVEAKSLFNRASLYGQTAVGVRTTGGELHNEGTIMSDAVNHLSSTAGIENSGRIASSRVVELEAATQVNNREHGEIAGSRSVVLDADQVVNKGLIGSSNGFLDLDAESEIINSGDIEASEDLYLQSGLTFGNDGIVSAGQTAVVVVTNGDLRNSGTVRGSAITLASKALDNDGFIHGTTTELVTDVMDAISNTGSITAPDILLRLGGEFDNKGHLSGSRRTQIGGRDGGSAASVVNHAGGFISGADELHVASGSIDNEGNIGSSRGDLIIESVGDVSNRGLLYSAGNSDYFVDRSLTNLRGDILAGRKLTMTGLSGPRIANIWNESGTIEAVGGDLQIDAERITNKRGAVSVRPVASTSTTFTPGKSNRTIAMTITRDTAMNADSPARIRAGGNLVMDADTVKNSHSQIAAGGRVAIMAELLINEGRDLLQTADVTTVIPRSERYCKTSRLGTCFDRAEKAWSETLHDKRVSVVGSIYGTIDAGTDLLVRASRYFQNNAVRGSPAGPNLNTVGDAAEKIVGTAPLVLSKMANPATLERILHSLSARKAVFETASPEATFLMETRSAFIDPGQWLSSADFMDQFGTEQARPSAKRYGDAYAEYRILRDQAFELTGEMWPSSPAEHNERVKEGYRNAHAVLTSLGLTVGEPLTKQQIGALTNDIIWLEKKDVLGEEVLVPRLYFAPARFDMSDMRSARTKAADDLSVDAALLHNSGAIDSESNLELHAGSDLVNHSGSIVAGGAVSLKAERTVANLSGLVSGSRVAMDADYVTNDTLKTRENYGNGYVDRLQGKAEIKAEGSMSVSARKSLSSEGGAFMARDTAYIQSAQTMVMSALPLARHREDGILDGNDRSSTVMHHPAQITAGDSVRLISGDSVTLRGATIEAEGVVGLTAQGDVEISSRLNSDTREVRMDVESGTLGTKSVIHKQKASANTFHTTLRASDLVTINSGSGSVKLEASRIDSQGDAEVIARAGEVALVSTEDVTTMKSFRREEDLLWLDQRDQDSRQTVVRHVETGSVGRLKILAGGRISADYANIGEFETSLDQMAQTRKLAWIKELRNDPNLEGRIEWRAVENKFEERTDEQHGLSEVGATLGLLLDALIPNLRSSVEGRLSSPPDVVSEVGGQAAAQPIPAAQNKL